MSANSKNEVNELLEDTGEVKNVGKPEKNSNKEAMKQLRKQRKDRIKQVSALVKEQKKTLEAIREQLELGSKTVPEISESINLPADKVLWFMAAMKKFGEIIEAGKDGSFYRYALVHAGADK